MNIRARVLEQEQRPRHHELDIVGVGDDGEHRQFFLGQ